jgi:putative lipoic acid-binding regulatory protein
MAAEEAPSLIEYPSLFPIKVMGVNDLALEQAIIDIALRFDPDYDRATLQLRPSRSGNYIGLTLSITATSREQLDALYSALSSHPMVKVVL